jgi:transketolase
MCSALANSNQVISALEARARVLRRHMLRMARGQGQGYIGQGLGIADLMTVLYFRELRFEPDDINRFERDRFLLSTGHYSIALWAALVEAGVLNHDELDTYGCDGSRLEMSASDATPGVEINGGSLGHGLGIGVGMAVILAGLAPQSRVFVELSDGEMQEGSTWEAAMAAAHFRADNLIALVDCNGIQADGKIVLNMEPVAAKWSGFGWNTQEIDGNSISALLAAFDASRARDGRPKVIILRTTPGKGVRTLEAREKAHFVRVDPGEWDQFERELEMSDV